MSDQGWNFSQQPGGPWNSSHAISKPIAVGGAVPQETMSPRSESLGPSAGALQMQIVDNVCGSPSSIQYGPPPQQNHRNIDRSNDGITQQFGIPIPNANESGTQGTPDFQMTPFLVQGGRVLGQGSSGPYGCGSWNAVYSNSNTIFPPVAPATDNVRDVGQSIISSSPPYGGFPNVMGMTTSFGGMSLGGNGPTREPILSQPPTIEPVSPMPTNGQCYFNSIPGSNQPNSFFGNSSNGVLQMNDWQQQQQQSQRNFMYPPQSNNTLPVTYSTTLSLRKKFGEEQSVTGQPRSSLLEDFRSSRTSNLQLSDIRNNVLEFAKDQHGSRFIQQKLERASPKDKTLIFQPVLENAEELMTDVFGNYVIQKFFEYGTVKQRELLVQAIKGNVMKLALQMYGCRVIQKALEYVEEKYQHEILAEMEGQVLKCVKDQNGNHVIQKVIERVEPQYLQFIIDAFTKNSTDSVYSLSIHPYGCRVIQRVLEHCSEEQKRPVLDALHCHLKQLVLDQYGNYVIQHVIEHGSTEDKDKIVKEISDDLLKFAQHKFASNVIEKCLTFGQHAQKNQLIEKVCGEPNDPSPPLLQMMKDPFANYVVQKMLDVADAQHRRKITLTIKPHINTLKKYNFGKHIIVKLEKYFAKQASPSNSLANQSPIYPPILMNSESDFDSFARGDFQAHRAVNF